MSALAKAHERRFGVEIECGHPGGREHVTAAMQAAGFPFASYERGGWDVGFDGSGVEVRTTILQGKDGFRELKRIFKLLNDEGCYVTTRDGMHVHHDAPELRTNPKLVIKLIDDFLASRGALTEVIAPRRVRNYGACPQWHPEHIAAIRRWAEQSERPNPSYRPNSRYAMERTRVLPVTADMPRFGRYDLNTDALREHGSIEWRLHEGSLNYDQAEAWIMLVQKFMHRAINGKTPVRARTRADLIRQVRLTKKQREVLDAKVLAQDFPPANGVQFVNGR